MFQHGIVAPRVWNEADSILVFRDRDVLMRNTDEGPRLPTILDVAGIGYPIDGAHYLGEIGATLCFAIREPTGEKVPRTLSAEFEYHGLRQLFGSGQEQSARIASAGLGILDWDAHHRFCGTCGTPTEVKEGERARACPSCGLVSFPRISPAIIVAIIRDGRILLAHNNRHKGDLYSIIAGFVEVGESLEDSVRREIREEVGLEVKDIKYFGSQPWPFPNSLMIGFVAHHASGEIEIDGEEIGRAAWYAYDKLPQIPPAGSISRRIIDWFVQISKKTPPDPG